MPALGGTDGVDPDYETNGTFLSISSDTSNPFYKIFSSASRIQINTTNNAIRFGNAGWVAGNSDFNSTNSTTPPSGDLDLSQAYSITMEIMDLPNAGGQLQVRVDNNTSSSGNSIHGTDSLLLSLDDTGGLALGTLVINVPGDVTMNGADIGDVPVHHGTANSFIAFRCPSNCGDTTAPDAGGIEISEVTIAYTGMPFTPAPPSIQTIQLTPGDTTIDVSWVAVGGATDYDVAYGTVDDPADAGTTIVEDVGGTSYQITGLVNGTQYFVFVRSQNANGNSEFTNNAPDPNPSATPTAGPPGVAPTGLVVTPRPERLDVSWDAVVGATEYDVAYNTADDIGTATVIADVASTSTTIYGLTPATDYFVFVRASNPDGDGPYSGSVSAQPIAQPATDAERTWSNVNGEFDEVIYGGILTNTPPTTANNDVVANSNTTINGLNFFTEATTSGPLRHRGSSNNEWNFNGSSYTSDVTTPAIGMAAPAQRVYIGVPVNSTEAVDIVVNYRNSSSSANAAVRIVFIGGTSGNVLCIADASSNVAGDATCSLPAAHGESEVRIIYSREGTGSGGMHVSSISRIYPGTDRTWSNSNGEFAEFIYTSILTNTPPTTTNNDVVADTNASINGLNFFTEATTSGPLRHRGSNSNEWNFNGSSYTSDVTTPAVGNAAPAQRVYIGVPVDPASAVDIIVNHRNSSSSANAAVRIVFIGGTSGNVLCISDSSSNTAGDTTCSLAAVHGESEVRIIYSREGTGSGGMHVGSITRSYP